MFIAQEQDNLAPLRGAEVLIEILPKLSAPLNGARGLLFREL